MFKKSVLDKILTRKTKQQEEKITAEEQEKVRKNFERKNLPKRKEKTVQVPKRVTN